MHHVNDHFCHFAFISENIYCLLCVCNFDSLPLQREHLLLSGLLRVNKMKTSNQDTAVTDNVDQRQNSPWWWSHNVNLIRQKKGETKGKLCYLCDTRLLISIYHQTNSWKFSRGLLVCQFMTLQWTNRLFSIIPFISTRYFFGRGTETEFIYHSRCCNNVWFYFCAIAMMDWCF